jgi:sugar lactone lactonase YvrE
VIGNNKASREFWRVVGLLAAAMFAGICAPSGLATTIYWSTSAGSDGIVYSTNVATGAVSTLIVGTGPGGNGIYYPESLAVGPDGNIYVGGDDDGLGDEALVKVTPQGVASTVVSPFQGVIGGLAFDSVGNLYAADSQFYGYVDKVTPTGTVSTLGGSLVYPQGGSVDPAGNLYVSTSTADSIFDNPGENTIITKITPVGVASTFATNMFAAYWDENGNLYQETSSGAITLTTSAGSVSTLATGLSAYLLGPAPNGAVYLIQGNGANEEIEMLSATGTITDLASVPYAQASAIIPEPSVPLALVMFGAMGISRRRRLTRRPPHRQRPSCQT